MRRIKPACVFPKLELLLLSTFALFLAGCAGQRADDVQIPEALQRQHHSEVRVMSWNVKRNSILPPDGARHESFARIVRAIDPDVIALQEVLRPDLVEVLAQLMNSYIPLQDGRSWQVHTVADNALISRYPLRHQSGELAVPYPIPELGLPNFHFGYAAALVDLPERFADTDIYVIAMHNKSGASEESVLLRQVHSDSVVRWIRNLRETNQASAISAGTPIVILGDMNVVPDAPMEPYETLLSGDIVDEETFGPDYRIDWDGTDMADARPSHNAKEQLYYTWRNDGMPFPPSALDRIIFTDSVLSVSQRFVLNTMTMSADELSDLGLHRSDVMLDEEAGYYDHLPLVTDFTLDVESGIHASQVSMEIVERMPVLKFRIDNLDVRLGLDLGSGTTLTLYPEVLDQLETVATGETIESIGMEGVVMESPVYIVSHVQLGDAVYHDLKVRQDDHTEQHRVDTIEYRGTFGRVGRGLFDNGKLIVDYQKGVLTIISPDAPDSDQAACYGTEIPLETEKDSLGLTTRVETDIGELFAVWDTGAPGNIMPKRTTDAAGLTLQARDEFRTEKFVIGGHDFGPVRMRVWDVPALPKDLNTLLGYWFFADKVVCIDFPSSTLFVRQRKD